MRRRAGSGLPAGSCVAGAIAVLVLVVSWAGPGPDGGVGAVFAAVPAASRIANAVAKANDVSNRAEPLWFEVALIIEPDPLDASRAPDPEATPDEEAGSAPAPVAAGPVAIGELATHPTGLARLELRDAEGRIERHLLQGTAYSASRGGQLIEHPHPYLPPVFLLQATSGATLRAALESFGVAAGFAELGRVDDHDCYVLGGRDHASASGIAPSAAPRGDGGPAGASRFSLATGGSRTAAPHARPSMWVDLDSFEVVRIERADGVRFDIGPSVAYDDIRAPSWIRIEAPGQPVARLEVRRVAPANAPAAAFGMDWLTAPLPGPAGDEPARESAPPPRAGLN